MIFNQNIISKMMRWSCRREKNGVRLIFRGNLLDLPASDDIKLTSSSSSAIRDFDINITTWSIYKLLNFIIIIIFLSFFFDTIVSDGLMWHFIIIILFLLLLLQLIHSRRRLIHMDSKLSPAVAPDDCGTVEVRKYLLQLPTLVGFLFRKTDENRKPLELEKYFYASLCG